MMLPRLWLWLNALRDVRLTGIKALWVEKKKTVYTGQATTDATDDATNDATDDATTDDRTATPNTKPTAPGQNYVKLPNGMLIYRQPSSEQVQKLTALTTEFADAFIDKGTFANIPEEEWMTIPLRTDLESRMPKKVARVYPQGTESRDYIDKTFNELHKTRRMSWSAKATPFSFPVFVTRRHTPYRSLQPIPAPLAPFHTISIDFILALPLSYSDCNCVMSVTCKMSKRITLIPGKDTWTAAQWANPLLERLWIADWGCPKVIISDRDRKFLSAFWKQLFTRLGVSLLYSTAWHPQTDGASERTNQTIDIALRYYFMTLEDIRQWPHCLPQLQADFNNAMTTTGRTPNEICYRFTPNFVFDLAQPELGLGIPAARAEVSDAIDWGVMNAKGSYDRKHTLMSKKLGQQYAGPFKVIERVGRLAYRLEIPEHWSVHNVFSIAHLEPDTPGNDPYNRPVPPQPPAVSADQMTWEVERILNKRVIKRIRGHATEYLIRWLG
jgi:hypothetical protein